MLDHANRIDLLCTGGTISMRRIAGKGASPALTAVQLAAAADVQEQVRPIQLANLGGPALTASVLTNLYHHVRVAQDRCLGVVVTLGTDAIEEVAFFLAVILRPRVPVILTGAMRIHDEQGADGPANLAYSVATVLDGIPPGVYVAFAGQLFEGARVCKAHTTDLNPFMLAQPYDDPLPNLPFNGFATPVYVVKPGLMDDLAFLDGVHDLHALVVEASGEGNLPATCEERIAERAAQLPVLLTSRTLNGELGATYGYPGGSKRLREAGVIPSRWPSLKLRLLASLAVAVYGTYARHWLAEVLA